LNEQDTVTGQLPLLVAAPTVQDQLMTPVEDAGLAPRPAALDGPDLYSTSMPQVARASVLIVAVALLPALIGEVSDVNDTGIDGRSVGVVLGASVGGADWGSVASGEGDADGTFSNGAGLPPAPQAASVKDAASTARNQAVMTSLRRARWPTSRELTPRRTS
jgi:hypothetical protein